MLRSGKVWSNLFEGEAFLRGRPNVWRVPSRGSLDVSREVQRLLGDGKPLSLQDATDDAADQFGGRSIDQMGRERGGIGARR
jgi:hypothetical protein